MPSNVIPCIWEDFFRNRMGTSKTAITAIARGISTRSVWHAKIQTVAGNERFKIEERKLANQVRVVY